MHNKQTKQHDERNMLSLSAPLTRSFIQPSAPPEEPQVASDFSWDFLYNALQPNAGVSICKLLQLC